MMHRSVIGVALLVACNGQSLSAQWSIAPSAAVGVSIPGTRHDELKEGVVAKAGVWVRAPRVPVGFTVEGMFSHLPGGRRISTAEGLTVGGAMLSVTTRRHERRVETYGVAGGGWYWYSNAPGRFTRANAPGFNAGVGELLQVRGHDLFAEVRFHAIRTPTASGGTWTTMLPIMLGLRF